MSIKASASKEPTEMQSAAVFVDYENLFAYVRARTVPGLLAADVIDELLHGVRDYLERDLRINGLRCAAYADFSEIHGRGQDIKHSLYLQGIEPRFVPASLQPNAAELQLSMDVATSGFTQKDERLVVIVSGDRTYLPVIQHAVRSGRRPVMISFEPPSNMRQFNSGTIMVHASDLLSDDTAQELDFETRSRRVTTPLPIRSPGEPSRSIEYHRITHKGALSALQVIEEHFGQYDEIYLTPLLRKLSELIGDIDLDPKALISELERARAVWLEKRKGFPYDYTVLIIDDEHPDVAAVRQQPMVSEPENDVSGYAPVPDYALDSYGDPYVPDADGGDEDYEDELGYDEPEHSTHDDERLYSGG